MAFISSVSPNQKNARNKRKQTESFHRNQGPRKDLKRFLESDLHFVEEE